MQVVDCIEHNCSEWHHYLLISFYISLDIMTVESNDSDWVILLDTCCSGNSLAAVAWCFYKCLFREVVFSADSFLLKFRLRFSSFIIKRQGVATRIIIFESSSNKMNQWPASIVYNTRTVIIQCRRKRLISTYLRSRVLVRYQLFASLLYVCMRQNETHFNLWIGLMFISKYFNPFLLFGDIFVGIWFNHQFNNLVYILFHLFLGTSFANITKL